MSKLFFLLLVLLGQIAVASEDEQGRKENKINFIECQIYENCLVCQPQDITEQIDSEKLGHWLDSLPEKNTLPSVVRINDGNESTYYALESQFEPGAVVKTVLNSSITGCEIAQLSITDQTGNTQYALITPTITHAAIEPLFDGELFQEEEIGNLQALYLCDKCSEIFQTSEACSRHRAKCRKRKNTEPDDGQPHKKKPNKKSFHCKKCSSSFPKASDLKKHTESIHERKRYTCDVAGCNSSHSSFSNLNSHKRKVHQREQFLCPEAGCGELFTQAAHRKKHVKSIHGKREYTCTKCNNSYTSARDLNKHLKGLHGKRKYACTQCNNSYTSFASFKQHIKSVHQGERYRCPVGWCGKLFTQPAHVKVHVKSIHEGILHACDDPKCKKVYRSEGALRAHQKTIHLGKRFRCPVDWCGKSLSQAGHLRVHINSVHQGKRYACTERGCKELFDMMTDLKRHQNRTGHQGYKDICQKECQKGQSLPQRSAGKKTAKQLTLKHKKASKKLPRK
ncbi:C2H2-type zinc finger protein [Candidatus Sororendozoicomonas aggregata]|uniref:C2H2-type zinc finger protein n=1 Tax=Candidatus Sororendozoicomonas aggregata TaxID=3073239 RepID=UPI002ED62B27